MNNKCQYCGRHNEIHAELCKGCGAPLSVQKNAKRYESGYRLIEYYRDGMYMKELISVEDFEKRNGWI